MRSQSRATGRPRKFLGPSRVVTLTLPESTIDKLSTLDADRARAIVRATEVAVSGSHDQPSVEVIPVAPGIGMLTVPKCSHLEGLPGVSLAQVFPGRFLIILTDGTTVAEMEIAVLDLLEGSAGDEPHDRAILEQLLAHLRTFRRTERMNLAEVILVATS